MTDLKPDNIFLHRQEGGRMVVKILDFGIARYAQELLATGDREKLTATQAMLGTVKPLRALRRGRLQETGMD